MIRTCLASVFFLAATCVPSLAGAVTSGEVYTAAPYAYGRFEARLRFAAGDGVVSSFFLWKDGSEVAGTFWNELDFEKLGADCHVELNAIYGNPSANHIQRVPPGADACGEYHTYAYEWTPDAVAWLIDGVEVRRDTGETAAAFAQNAAGGMQLRFNVWPGDATFGGNFSPDILPVHQYIDWVQFSSYDAGAFTLAWREDFDTGTLPSGWASATWGSPKNLSTHDPRNVNFMDGVLVISLTADDATGPAGAMPGLPSGGGNGGSPGTAGGGGTGGLEGGSAGTPAVAGSGGTSVDSAGSSGSGGSAGAIGGAGNAPGAGGSMIPSSSGGAPGSAGTSSSAGVTGSAAAGGSVPAPGQGGATGVAGTNDTGGSGASTPQPASDGGCSFSVAGGSQSRAWFGALGLGAALLGRRMWLRKRATRA